MAVLGANGAGKSTLMSALSGFNRPVGGPCTASRPSHRDLRDQPHRREGLVLVPEGRQVFPELSVFDNICLGAYARGGVTRRRKSRAAARPVPAAASRAGTSGRACSPAASNRCWRSRAGSWRGPPC